MNDANNILLGRVAPCSVLVRHDIQDLVPLFRGDDVIASSGRRDQMVAQFLFIFPLQHRLSTQTLERANKQQWRKVKTDPQNIIFIIGEINIWLSIRKSINQWPILMRLYSPVNLIVNVNMTEELVLGRTWTGEIFSLTPLPLSHRDTHK